MFLYSFLMIGGQFVLISFTAFGMINMPVQMMKQSTVDCIFVFKRDIKILEDQRHIIMMKYGSSSRIALADKKTLDKIANEERFFLMNLHMMIELSNET